MRARVDAALLLCAAILIGAAVSSLAGAQETTTVDWETPVLGPVRVLIDGINSGDIPSVEAVLAPAATIVDEIPPFYWSGPGAYAKLMKDFDAVSKAQGTEEFVVRVIALDQVQATEQHGYVVLFADVMSRAKGVSSHVQGQFVISLERLAGEWKIVHWSWAVSPQRS